MLRYTIFDPTGNITALVESETPVPDQPAVAASLMRRHPEVEQVGFVNENALRMAGGEFCGNASMCAAALLLLRAGQDGGELQLNVSGAPDPVKLRLSREGAGAFRAEILMPRALGLTETALAFEGLHGSLPLVRFAGISHLIAEADSAFFPLLRDRARAESAVRAFCGELRADGLGLLFLEGQRMTPLVYVPASATVFWENSCASGSAAVGMYRAGQRGASVELALRQPGGLLRVRSDPAGGTRLTGSVRFLGEYETPA